VAIGPVSSFVAGYNESVVLIILASVIVVPAIVLAVWKDAMVSAKKIDGQYVWVRGCCKEYRASLPEFPDLR